MAFLAALFAIGSRFAGKIVTTALGWASTLLFGRVPASRQILMLGITFGSVIWVVLLAGVLFPDLGTFLLVFVPDQQLIPESTIRLLMLLGAAIVPALVGILTLLLQPDRPRTPRRVAGAIGRGYPLTALLAVLLVFLAALAVVRKARSLARRWDDAHVPFVVEPGKYDEVADDLDRALAAADIEVTPSLAPAAMSKPARWVAAIAGEDAAALVPPRMIQLQGDGLDILIYPMDLLVTGRPELVVRARAAMASRLTTSAAHLTVTAEAQHIEDRIAALAQPAPDHLDAPRRFDEAVVAEFETIDQQLSTVKIPYDEWEVLYRERLQVERDLRAGAMAGTAVLGAGTPGTGNDAVVGVLETLGRLLRDGAGTVVEVAADERTGAVLDRAAGPGWRWAVRAASVAAVAAREVIRGRDDARTAADPATSGDGHGPAAPVAAPAEPAADQGQPPSDTS
ncbi:MAG TPA: hypothetical protein VFI69_04640 [Candidatus Limnocylindrales bacterium]|nr:hypothetical protein [Candidatus Limnocylindrales bacterium]